MSNNILRKRAKGKAIKKLGIITSYELSCLNKSKWIIQKKNNDQEDVKKQLQNSFKLYIVSFEKIQVQFSKCFSFISQTSLL